MVNVEMVQEIMTEVPVWLFKGLVPEERTRTRGEGEKGEGTRCGGFLGWRSETGHIELVLF